MKNNNILKIVAAILFVVLMGIMISKDLSKDTKDFEEIYKRPYSTSYSYEEFIKKHPTSRHVEKACDELYKIALQSESISNVLDFSKKHPRTKQAEKAKEYVENTCDTLYAKANAINTIESWKSYLASVPRVEYRDAEEKISKLEKELWGTEPKAWVQAKSINSIDSYTKYLSLYPNGENWKKAEKMIIDIQVSDVFLTDHGQLPAMDKVGFGQGSSSIVRILNKTPYTLTLLYSGNDSQKIVLSSGSSKSVSLSTGTYRIAASVNAPNVRSFAGQETLTGGEYEVEYYISTIRY